MTPEDSAQDKELLERFRRASDTEAIAPSEAVRAAILAEARRVAERRSEAPRSAFDTSRPAANDSRWKITAFGTVGAALLAALLFAPRYWESVTTARISSAPPATPDFKSASADKSATSDAAAVPPPKAESLTRASPVPAEPLEEVVVTQAIREGPKANAGAVASLKRSAPAPEKDSIGRPESGQAPASTQPSIRPAAAPTAAPALPMSASSLNADRAARARNAPALTPTTLQSAAALGNVTQAVALLDQGVAVDARDELGRTPLMLAVMQDRLEVVRLLLTRGADPNAADNTGRTPLQRAKQENFRDVAALLERSGAR